MNQQKNTKEFFEKAYEKSNEYHKGELSGLMDYIKSFFKMSLSLFTGRYKKIPTTTIMLAMGSMLYTIMPFDFDFIPIIGYLDDLTIWGFVFARLKKDIDKFYKWEQSKVEPVEVVDG